MATWKARFRLLVIRMWYKNIAGRFFRLVTKHACDRRTDRLPRPEDNGSKFAVFRYTKIAQ